VDSIHQYRSLNFCVAADDAVIANPAPASDYRSGAHFNIATDPHRPLDGGAGVNSAPFSDDDSIAGEFDSRIDPHLDFLRGQIVQGLAQRFSQQEPRGLTVELACQIVWQLRKEWR
jgi:hypothetical protein